jgi:hypothetical protein
MATVRDLITDAHKLLGVLAAGATLRAADATDGLTMLQRMLDAWNADRLALYTVTRSTYTWTAAASSRTLGASGQLSGQRPEWIEYASVIEAGETNERPVEVLTREQFARISDKTTTDTVFHCLSYEPTYPNGTLTVYPVPTTAPTLVLHVPTALTSAVTLDTTVSYPPGYEEAAQYQLAKRIAPFHPGTWTDLLAELARDAYGRIKSVNVRVEPMRCDPALVGSGGYGHWNIETDGYTR